MDVATKSTVAFLGLVIAGFVWWVVAGAVRERRRARAEVWAQAQEAQGVAEVEMGKHHQADEDGPTIPAQWNGRHHNRHRDDVVTVPDLLARAAREGDVLRLAWPADDEDEGTSIVRPHMRDEFPTGVLPLVRDERSTESGWF